MAAMCSTSACFNPRPRAGGDYSCPISARICVRFNPRPRAGGDSILCDRITDVFCFNPRPRAGGDGRRREGVGHVPCFNPRPRAGGDPPLGMISAPVELFQSTPPRRGRLDIHINVQRNFTVSIHAPAQGATA